MMRASRKIAIYLFAGLVIALPSAITAQITITVDAAADRKPINPMIYGTAFATTAQLIELNSPLNRSGGNATTRYNWQQNASNRANDWYFQSLDDGSPNAGDAGDVFIQSTKNGLAQPAMTIPIIDWIAKSSDRIGSGFPAFPLPNMGHKPETTGSGFLTRGTGSRPTDSLSQATTRTTQTRRTAQDFSKPGSST
jgi:hypothetical protein